MGGGVVSSEKGGGGLGSGLHPHRDKGTSIIVIHGGQWAEHTHLV